MQTQVYDRFNVRSKAVLLSLNTRFVAALFTWKMDRQRPYK